MRNLFILMFILLTTAFFSNVSAQVTPPGASDKDLRDTDVKGRSNELERIDRETRKQPNKTGNNSAVNPAAAEPKDKLAGKYGEIKTDYEQIQISQDSIVKTYQGSGKIDYAEIGKFSQEINKSGMRLKVNLFPVPVVETPDAGKVENADAKNGEKVDKETKTPKSVRDLIVDLDNAIGSFATSTMFQNLRVVDAAVSEKTRLDLEKIIELSAALSQAAGKTKSGN